MPRSVKPWVGKTDDSRPPPRVRQRVFDRDKGLCHVCKQPIKPGETWEADHVKALINGGSNSEGNLSPAHSHCHVKKTHGDIREKAKTARVRQKDIGATRPSSKLATRNRPKAAKVSTKPSLSPRQLFREANTP